MMFELNFIFYALFLAFLTHYLSKKNTLIVGILLYLWTLTIFTVLTQQFPEVIWDDCELDTEEYSHQTEETKAWKLA